MHFQIVCYVPLSHVEHVKKALFSAGAGQLGVYEKCCWQTLGEAQFFVDAGATPFIGEVGELVKKVEEVKLEVFCHRDHLEAACAAMCHAHPYETPVYAVLALHASSAQDIA